MHDPVAPWATLPADLDPQGVLADPQRLAMVPTPGRRTRRALDGLAHVAAEVLGGDRACVVVLHAAHQDALGTYGRAPGTACHRGLCAETLALGVPLMLGDLLEDRVAACHPAAADGVRAYAGHPVHLTGERVGVVCVTSTRPRAWTIGDCQRLQSLARMAAHLLASEPVVADPERPLRRARPRPVRGQVMVTPPSTGSVAPVT